MVEVGSNNPGRDIIKPKSELEKKLDKANGILRRIVKEHKEIEILQYTYNAFKKGLLPVEYVDYCLDWENYYEDRLTQDARYTALAQTISLIKRENEPNRRA